MKLVLIAVLSSIVGLFAGDRIRFGPELPPEIEYAYKTKQFVTQLKGSSPSRYIKVGFTLYGNRNIAEKLARGSKGEFEKLIYFTLSDPSPHFLDTPGMDFSMLRKRLLSAIDKEYPGWHVTDLKFYTAIVQ